MYLIQSWKDSLSLFVPKNFKLFALVGAKTIGQTYWLAFKYFWWVPVLYVLINSGVADFDVYGVSLLSVLGVILVFGWEIVVCLCARPSVAQKNYRYFASYLFYGPGICIGLAIIATAFIAVASGFLFGLNWVGMQNMSVIMGIKYLTLVVLMATTYFFIFFVLDRTLGLKNWVKSLRNTFTFLWYNIPGVLVLTGALFCISYLIDGALSFLPFAFKDASDFLKVPIMASILCNFYIKRLHEQPQLYFAQPNE